jgi:hypothetical protein
LLKYTLFTNDVETTSIWHNRLSDKTGEKVLKEGMPHLLELYRKYKIRCTFFYTGEIAQNFPEIVRMILSDGHEVGCHGLTHEVYQAFDQLSLNDQKDHLKKSKDILEKISGQEVISFRATALRTNDATARALIDTGFKIDSSVSSQRFDMFLSFGSLKKMYWLTAPRLPYKTAADNLLRKGNGPLIEVPISAALIPYIGTTLRIFPTVTKMIRYFLHLESKWNNKPIVFLFHPNEIIDESAEPHSINKRASNLFSFLLGDLLRSQLKVKNLGERAIPLLEKELSFFKNKGYSFCTLKEYCQLNNFLN